MEGKKLSVEPKKKVYLDWLFYDVGKQADNFVLQYLKRQPDGSVIASKHVPYLDAQGDESFLARCNNRGVLKCEVILDLDLLPKETPEMLLLRREQAVALLREKEFNFLDFYTGSKGHHIHLFMQELLKMSDAEVQEIKRQIIKFWVNADTNLVHKHTIALEFAPHWKTGNKKVLTDWEGEYSWMS